LFIKLIEQGSTVLAYRALCRAVELVGRENVYFLVFEENRHALDFLGVVLDKNVMIIRQSSLTAFLIDTFRCILRIRRERIDSVVDMEFFTRAPAILSYLTGAKRRVGFHRFTSEIPYRGDLMTHRIQYNPYIHTALTFLLLVEALTRDPSEVPLMKCELPQVDLSPPTFEPTQEEIERVQNHLDHVAGRRVEPPIVLLNPNASDLLPIRRWPTERFIELARRILQEFPKANIVITGSPAERTAGNEIARCIASDRVICMAGETTLRELLVLYTLSDVLVTNDSGPAHFASLTEIESICLFGPETPRLYGPLGRHSHVIWAELACSPCANVFNHRFSPCRDNVCMKAISTDVVYAKVREALVKKRY